MGRAGKIGGAIKGIRSFRLTRSKLELLLVFFVLFSLVSMAGLYLTHSVPVEEEETITLASYQHEGRYDYVAELRPNILYENRLTLGPGEGTLYTEIVENVDIVFHYKFSSFYLEDIMTEYSTVMELEAPGKWVKDVTGIIENSAGSTGNGEFSIELPIEVSWVEELAGAIESETGTSSSQYDLKIKPEIHVVAETGVGTVDEVFAPELTVSLRYGGAEGDQITMSDLVNTSPGAIQRTETIYHPEVEDQRSIFYVVSIVALVGLVFTGWGFARTRPRGPERVVEKIISPFKETIMEVAEEPSLGDQMTSVPMKSLEDLVSVAEGLGKPVLHLKKPSRAPSKEWTHVFYVLDGLVRYEYRLKLSNKIGSKNLRILRQTGTI